MYIKPVIHNGKNYLNWWSQDFFYQQYLILVSPLSLHCAVVMRATKVPHVFGKMTRGNLTVIHFMMKSWNLTIPVQLKVKSSNMHYMGPLGNDVSLNGNEWTNCSATTIHLIQTSAPLNSHTSMFHVLWLEDGWLSGCVHLIRNIAYQ